MPQYWCLLSALPGKNNEHTKPLKHTKINGEKISMLEMKNICKSYHGRPALDHISLSLEPGTLYTLVGPHASGKTTLLQILAGLIPPDSGELFLDGRQIPPASKELSLLTGYLPENYSFYKHLTAYEYLEYFCAFYGIYGLNARCRCNTLLEQLELTAFKNTPVEFLPTSFKQSLQLARMVLHKPSMLLIDNIRQNMDTHTRLITRNFLTRQTEEGTIVILSTRVLSGAPALAHQIGYMQNGRLLLSGSLEKLQAQLNASAPLRIRVCARADAAYSLLYKHPFVRTLTREKNVFSVELIVDYRSAPAPGPGESIVSSPYIGPSIEMAESKLLADLIEADIPVSGFYREKTPHDQLFTQISEVAHVQKSCL